MTIKVCALRVHGEGTPPLDVVTALAEGWAGAGLAPIRAGLGTKARMIRLPVRQEDAERLLDGLAH